MSEHRMRQVARHIWDALVLLVALVLGVLIPLRVVLPTGIQPLSPLADSAVTLLFALDAARRVRDGLRAPMRPRSLWLWVAVDVVAALPFGRMLGLPAANLARLAKLASVATIVRQWRRAMVIHPTIMRLSAFVIWASLLAHWLACGWILLDGPTAELGIDSHYLTALYWCVTTLTTVGYGDVTPTNADQTIYTMVVMLLGVGVYGYVIGNVASLLSKIDMAKTQYVSTMERLTGFLRYHKVPAPLQREIYAYYKHVWENRMGYEEAALLDDLPPGLRAEVSLVLKQDLIKKVEFLKDASPALIQDLCLKLRPVVYTPGDVVVQAGEIGHHVYFISRGTVEVVAADGKTVIRRMSDGEFFGELALLQTDRRTATVRAVGYCDFYVLDKDTFHQVLQRYPEFSASVRAVSETRTLFDDETPEAGNPVE